MDLQAPEGRTPAIWVAGHGARMLELTGTYGDGWYPTMVTTPQEYATKLAVIRAAATRCGRDPQAITPALHRFVVVARTDHEVQALLRHKSVRMLGLAAPAQLWRNLGAQHPFGEDFRGYVDIVPQHYDRPTLDKAIAAVPPELVEQGPLLWGTPPQVIDKLRAFGDAGLRHVVLAPVSGLASAKAALYALWAMRPIAHALKRARHDPADR
jgi:phthiodiolone/phenolphthiodiolone dimycocerosates ketoreductase